MPRFFCPLPFHIGAQLDLPASTAHHVFVLRLQVGDQIEIFNGEGGSYLARLTAIEKKRASVAITDFHAREAELPFSITLAQALPEGSKMDWIIEKAVELGVQQIQPLAAQRCVVKLNADRAEKKLEHWRAIIISASEQCGRNRLAQLEAPIEVQKFSATSGQRILLSPRATQSLTQWAQQQAPQAITIMIGPEGGFTDAEENDAVKQGAFMLSMGPRVLRTETAGLAAMSVLSAAWGGM
ncbi:MAG: 16S rRNA (uracil(1498)-N(3))-methyltransferase [Burkholderiales bacterium]|nr:16S rRNA (uracil(1498)-N(3))-methyltransferase [Burkholderiales bacterium]